jgi:glycosyltransferase involved in cell wall biosynthesis
LPFLSIVLPVRNEKEHLGAVLEQLRSQDYPHDRFEILVANGKSVDGTGEVVESFGKNTSISVRLIQNPKQLSSAGRNVGTYAARGEYIFYLDGHCVIPNKSMLRDAITLFEKTGADCLCRPQPLTIEGNAHLQKVIAHSRATAFGHGRDSTIYNMEYEGPINPTSAGALYRRSVFAKVGFYDENFDACEDVEFNYRVFQSGLKSWISPRLAVFYHPRNSLVSLWKQMVRYGRGRYRFITKHPDAITIGQLIPQRFFSVSWSAYPLPFCPKRFWRFF